MKKVTIFRKFTEIVKHSTIEECIEEIRNGNFKSEVEEIRKINNEKGKEAVDILKKNLLGFTASGKFETQRRKDVISEYNQCIILDFDDISANYLQEAKDIAILALYTLAAFISPRGTGLKIIVKVNTELKYHDLAFKQVAEYYSEALNEEVDPSGKDCSRLCFMSYDSEAHYNSEAEIFQVIIKTEITKHEKPLITDDEIFNEIVEFTNQKLTYSNGSRNNYIHLLACNCNRRGLDAAFTESQILQTFDLDEKEVTATVKSAYELNRLDFGKFPKTANTANFATSAEDDKKTPLGDVLKSMPFIPSQVYDALPAILSKGAEAFLGDDRKRDVFLTSALTILSGCLPNVYGIYHQDRVYPNLFSFIIAPAANGKGVLKNAKRLADKYHNKLCEQSKVTKLEYESAMLQYKLTCAKFKKGEEPPEKPEEPQFKRVFIPADTSQAMLIKMINDNDGNGIICETEADTMAGANKQDWGNYSPILRGAFHHEKVSVARKTNNEVLEIQEPKIAVCLSGTPAQVPRLIGSAEDGLFSRFMFYAFRSPIEWKSPAPQENGIIHDDHFTRLSEEVLQMVEMLQNHPTEIKLSNEQWQNFDEEFADLLQQTVIFNTDDIAGVVYRLGLITFRICMVLSSLRKFENGDTAKIITCTDEDFTTAILLSRIYIQHSTLMFNNLSEDEPEKQYKPTGNKQKLIQLLPAEFQRKQAVEEGNKLGLSERTVDALLQKLVPSILEKIKDGFYKKRK